MLFTGQVMRRWRESCYTICFTTWMMRIWKRRGWLHSLFSPQNEWWEGKGIVVGYSLYCFRRMSNAKMTQERMNKAWLLALFSSQNRWWGDETKAVTLFVSQNGWWKSKNNDWSQNLFSSQNERWEGKKKWTITHSTIFTGWVMRRLRKKDDSFHFIHRMSDQIEQKRLITGSVVSTGWVMQKFRKEWRLSLSSSQNEWWEAEKNDCAFFRLHNFIDWTKFIALSARSPLAKHYMCINIDCIRIET